MQKRNGSLQNKTGKTCKGSLLLITLLLLMPYGCNHSKSNEKKDKDNETLETVETANATETFETIKITDTIKINEEFMEIIKKSSILRTVLEKQLREARSEEYEISDLEAAFYAGNELLSCNGYVQPTDSEFKEKIKLIFGGELDTENPVFTDINFICGPRFIGGEDGPDDPRRFVKFFLYGLTGSGFSNFYACHKYKGIAN